MLQIPITSDAPYFSQESHIFGRHYLIEFEWIEREGFWVMHFYDSNERALLLGARILPGWPIFLEQELNIAFMLIVKNPNSELNLKTLRSDFILVAYAPI